MYTKLMNVGILSGIVLLFAACKNEGDDLGDENDSGVITTVSEIDYDFDVPATYVFTRDSETTVSFGGQSDRLYMGKEILGFFDVNTTKTAENVKSAFNHSENGNDFDDANLNESSKKIQNKVASSNDLNDAVFAAESQNLFISYIDKFFAEIVPSKDVVASKGVAGYVGEKPRYVNSKGMEYNQLFNKGLIGALVVDQVLNNYLGDVRVGNEEYIADNTNETLLEGENYTTYEHHFDEAYGYVYGAADNPIAPVAKGDDKFLFTYITQVNGMSAFSGIQDQIFSAFKIGRAAVVAQDYDVLEDAIEVLQYQISKVVAVRAVYYLEAGKNNLAAQEYESAFHGLSEAYGFIYSLQFTRNPNTGEAYLSISEVEALLSKLDAGDGFWDLTDGTVLDEISNTIADKFDFTVAEAAE
ncbi:DUF4856 domain-containing protein [Flavicella sp.]|uniref:DUF4856 domain-containing protein n=1 Tax=Flavicella sp. TaxID=2957742 RepID=UPI0030184528